MRKIRKNDVMVHVDEIATLDWVRREDISDNRADTQ